MDIRAPDQRYNPYRIFSRAQWAALRNDTPMTLEPGEFSRLRSLHDRLDFKEVEEIYLPLSRLLSIYVDAAQGSIMESVSFLGSATAKSPTLSVSPARPPWVSRPPRASYKRCSHGGRRGPKSTW
jgi:type I pantothenate kinase